MKKVLALIGMAVFLASISPALAVQTPQNKVKSFSQWCKERKTVSVGTRRTIDVLMKKAGTIVLSDNLIGGLNDSIVGSEIAK
jgi:hypothetical protein